MPHDDIGFETEDSMWDAVVGHDSHATGYFVYAVKTTGIYCHPACAARRPHRQNVLFFRSATLAQQNGFRPCKRCQPHAFPDEAPPTQAEKDRTLVAKLCRRIEGAGERPSLAMLSADVGLSPFHMQRVFKRVTGLTPKTYWKYHQERLARDRLTQEKTVTEAIYAAGYTSSSRFYEAAPSMLGMKPARYRRGAVGETIATLVLPCSLGQMLVAGTARGICAVTLGDDAAFLLQDLRRRFPKAEFIEGDDEFGEWVRVALSLIDGTGTARTGLPLDLQGTLFQCQVWQALTTIPLGTTITYGELAKRIGRPNAVRAVAAACGANPVSVVIPCHRVIGASGHLTGYRWGVVRKQQLLAREAVLTKKPDLDDE